MLRLPKLFVLLVLSVLLVACSSTPPTSISERQLGDAKNNLKSSDFKAALDNLSNAIKSAKNDSLRQQALVLRVALVTALADANEQLAEAYYTGAKQPLAHSNTGAFNKARSDYSNAARDYLMDAMQSVLDQRSKLGADPMSIEVAFPGFTGGEDQGLAKIKSGELIAEAERVNTELQLERNCLAEVLAGFVGTGQDLNKARGIFNAGKVDVDPRVYIVTLSDEFMHTGAMFDTRWNNQPEKFRTVNQVVLGNLEVASKLLATKPDKDLEARVKKMHADCDKCLKKIKA
ncbi:MAG TPA: hypothetical protein VEI54_12045 [Candidatus Limnocylindrales bacterium]|nr:hypothetical protein [Candidatus Limnocylindrales bacterium]